MRVDQLAWLDASAAFVLFAAGCLLVSVEFMRPGWVLPGAAGMVIVIVSAVRLARMNVTPLAALLLAASCAALLIEARFRWSPMAGLLPGILLVLAATQWGAGPGEKVRLLVAIPLSFVLCSLAVILGSAAWRGYWAKRHW